MKIRAETNVGITSVLRRYCVGACVGIALVGCTPEPRFEAAPSLRNQETPIGATARFDEGKFAGLWYLRGYLPEKENFDQLAFRTGASGPQFRVAAFVCDPAGVCGNFAEDLPTKRLGKGRYQVEMFDGQPRDLWVLWVDEGFRTAVIGNPQGTFAWIIDRASKGGTDRIKAAREILDFNGYDPRTLKVK